MKGFSGRRIFFKLLRARSMGEYVPFFESEVKELPAGGAEWPGLEFPMKEICRNDHNRSLRIEVHDWEVKNEQVQTQYLAEYDFTLSYMKRHAN